VLSGPHVILILKIAVLSVTAIFLASLVALALGRYRLHGRLNVAFFILTLLALLGLEVVTRLIDPDLFAYMDEDTRQALRRHLLFSLPAVVVLPLMVFTGGTHRRHIHLCLAVVFCILCGWVKGILLINR
jgi:hypothetical protein